MGPSRRQDMRAAVPGHGCARKVEDRADASKSHHHPGARHQMGMRKRPETVATPEMHSPNGPLSAVGAATPHGTSQINWRRQSKCDGRLHLQLIFQYKHKARLCMICNSVYCASSKTYKGSTSTSTVHSSSRRPRRAAASVLSSQHAKKDQI